MPLYAYECPNCGQEYESLKRGLESTTLCQCESPIKRKWMVNLQRPMPDHYNTSVGKYVTGKRQLTDEFKRMSDNMTERTGIPHNYVPVDPNDKETFGVTDEGLQATHDRMVKQGMKPPAPKLIL